MTLQATVSMNWVDTVLSAAERQGVARTDLLARAGIAAEELARERWPIDHITRLWRAAAAATQDAGFGLKAGQHVGPHSFAAISRLLAASPTLRQAIAAVQRYQRLISDGGRFQAGAEASWLVYHPRLGPLAGYRAAFDCPVRFEQAFSGVLLANAVLDAPLPRANARAQRLHGRDASARLAALGSGPQLAQELRAWLLAELQSAQLPTRAQAARVLLISERTLARRMKDAGLSFSGLLDQARRELALAAATDGIRSLAEIGQSLGYAEPAVFWRTFRRWTGCTPGQWRERAAHDAVAQRP